MRPLYDERIEDLGECDFLRVDCIARGHDEMIPRSGFGGRAAAAGSYALARPAKVGSAVPPPIVGRPFLLAELTRAGTSTTPSRLIATSRMMFGGGHARPPRPFTRIAAAGWAWVFSDARYRYMTASRRSVPMAAFVRADTSRE